MSITRAALVTRFGATLPEVLAFAGLPTTDSAGGLKEPLDDALSALGVADEDLANVSITVARAAAITVGRYYVLLRIRDAIAHNQTDFKAGDVELKRKQYLDWLDKEIALSQASASSYVTLEGDLASAWGAGTISLGYLEPAYE